MNFNELAHSVATVVGDLEPLKRDRLTEESDQIAREVYNKINQIRYRGFEPEFIYFGYKDYLTITTTSSAYDPRLPEMKTYMGLPFFVVQKINHIDVTIKLPQ